MEFKIYTDGSSRMSKNSGGIGIVWIKDDKVIQEYSKGFKNATNNQMELIAIYIALRSIKKPIDSLEILSDSEYSIGVLTKPWKPKKNIELIAKIKKQIVETQKLVKEPIKWTHVDGHKDNEFNNRADFLATQASDMVL